MLPKSSLAKILVAGILALFATASASGQDVSKAVETITAHEQTLWPNVPPPEGTVAIPVMVPKDFPAGAKTLLVCTFAGGQPRRWEVLTRGCRDQADYCTVFAAAPLQDAMAFIEYDVGKPPVAVATDNICTAPAQPMTGVLGHQRP